MRPVSLPLLVVLPADAQPSRITFHVNGITRDQSVAASAIQCKRPGYSTADARSGDRTAFVPTTSLSTLHPVLDFSVTTAANI